MRREGDDPAFVAGLVTQVDPAAVLTTVLDDEGHVVDFRYLEVNEDACAFLGHSRDALLGGSLLELFPQQAGTPMFAAMVDVVRTGETLALDDEVVPSAVRPAGTRFDVRMARILDMLMVSWRDNTERTRAAAALAASEERLRLMAEHSSDAVLMADIDGTVVWASDSTATSFGWQPSALVGRPVFALLHPDDLHQNAPVIAEVRRGHSGVMVGRLRTGSGDYRWVSSKVTPLTDDTGAVVRTVAGWRDIHQQRLAELALSEANERLQQLVDNSSDAVAAVDASGRFTWVSNGIRSLTGWQSEQLRDEHLVSFVHEHDADLVRAMLARLQGGLTVTFEARLRSPVGVHRWVSFQARPEHNDAGVVTGCVVGLRDIDAERQARAELARSENRFRVALHSAPIGMAVVDLERRFLAVNASMCRLLGQLESWVLVRRVTDVLDPQDRELDALMRGQLIVGEEESAVAEVRLVHRSGRVVWVRHVLGLVRAENGEPSGYVSQFLDLSEQPLPVARATMT